jgi:hypothetical protein
MNGINRIMTFVSIIFILSSCGSYSGTEHLGNNLYLSEGDHKEDKVIIFCNSKVLGSCSGGQYIFPTYSMHYTVEGGYQEYIGQAKADTRWIIAETLNKVTNQEKLWILDKELGIVYGACNTNDCDSLIMKFVKGPFNKQGFNKVKDSLGIRVDFEK